MRMRHGFARIGRKGVETKSPANNEVNTLVPEGAANYCVTDMLDVGLIGVPG